MIEKLDKKLEVFCKWAIVICIFTMLGLSILNIVLRWFELSILWIEPFVRHLVFLSTFLGGVLATGANQHIKIDLLSRLMEKFKRPRLQKVVDGLVLLVTLVACLLIVKSSYDLTLIEFEFGKAHFLNIHSGYLVGIIPVGMSLVCLRVMTQLWLRLKAKES